jgi:hypothetical protein
MQPNVVADVGNYRKIICNSRKAPDKFGGAGAAGKYGDQSHKIEKT